MNRPILLADVDGVFNPFPFDPARSADWKFEPTFTSSQESGAYRLDLSRELGAAVLALGCDIQWLTSWAQEEDFANPEVGRALGWGFKSVAQGGPHPKMNALLRVSWKMPAVAAALQNNPGKVVWVDDEAVDFLEKLDMLGVALDAESEDPRLLVVAPESSVGLTKAQLAQVQKFLEE